MDLKGCIYAKGENLPTIPLSHRPEGEVIYACNNMAMADHITAAK